jgi:hypothetical protein
LVGLFDQVGDGVTGSLLVGLVCKDGDGVTGGIHG